MRRHDLTVDFSFSALSLLSTDYMKKLRFSLLCCILWCLSFQGFCLPFLYPSLGLFRTLKIIILWLVVLQKIYAYLWKYLRNRAIWRALLKNQTCTGPFAERNCKSCVGACIKWYLFVEPALLSTPESYCRKQYHNCSFTNNHLSDEVCAEGFNHHSLVR